MTAKGYTPTLTNGDIPLPCAPGDYAVRVNEEVTALWANVQPAERILTVAGTVTVGDEEALVVTNLALAGAVGLTLGTVAARAGLRLKVIDWAGTATITITPHAGETIMAQASWVIGAGGAGMGGKCELIPNETLSGWLVSVG